MLKERYYTGLNKVLEQIQETQKEHFEEAAKLIADSVASGGRIHLLDTGHMLMHEIFGRVGGLMLVNPVRVTVEVENPAPPRPQLKKKRVYMDGIEGLPEFILGSSEIFAGDVLIIGSVSGKNILPVEIAIKAKEMGVKTIALTSTAYSASLPSAHPSGKRLYEVADVYLDNCGVIGDAVVPVEGLEVNICPTSGIAAAFIYWSLAAEVVEELLTRGITPSVYMSNHLPGAGEFNRRNLERYESKGY